MICIFIDILYKVEYDEVCTLVVLHLMTYFSPLQDGNFMVGCSGYPQVGSLHDFPFKNNQSS